MKIENMKEKDIENEALFYSTHIDFSNDKSMNEKGKQKIIEWCKQDFTAGAQWMHSHVVSQQKDTITTIENLLDKDNPTTLSNWMSWDKGDCSKVGIIRILLIQTIQNEIKEQGEYYDGSLDKLLFSLNNDYLI